MFFIDLFKFCVCFQLFFFVCLSFSCFFNGANDFFDFTKIPDSNPTCFTKFLFFVVGLADEGVAEIGPESASPKARFAVGVFNRRQRRQVFIR